MTDRVSLADLSVAAPLADFISREALPGSEIDPDAFWEREARERVSWFAPFETPSVARRARSSGARPESRWNLGTIAGTRRWVTT